MEDGNPNSVWDLNQITEKDFDQHSIYKVSDQPCDDENNDAVNDNDNNDQESSSTKTKQRLTKAEQSLPRNLILKPSKTIKDVSKIFLKKSDDFIFIHENFDRISKFFSV
ncbi:hypothetical protein BLA29_001465 [Euroglyphus maynei]|uniref:Uncharacterized protein n=1 Tax=Euroglyphus maynei TaxID=6958 RepID=A0A1Y3BMX3_EURMA|nr:hypothetical protein BLA29_001465 [Euroglyphus maynei]